MIYITGDTHSDIKRFKSSKIKKLKKNDTLIICGDFGFSVEDNKSSKKTLKWIGKRKYTVAFIDGANDDYEKIKTFPEIEFAGSTAFQLSNKLVCLKRGEIYKIEGKTIMAFGGGDFIKGDDSNLCSDKSTNLPTCDEMNLTVDNLAKNNMQVDLIITYDAPEKIKLFVDMEDNETGFTNAFLQKMSETVKFKSWCFGKFHVNKLIPPYYHMIFTEVIKFDK